MRTIPVALALVVCALAGPAAPASGSGSDERAAGYKTYVACSTKASGKPSHECRQSQPKAAYFVSKDRDATYKVCVKFPGKKRRLCASAQEADKGEKSYVTIATASTGKHKVAWYVGGTKVGGWNFDVIAG